MSVRARKLPKQRQSNADQRRRNDRYRSFGLSDSQLAQGYVAFAWKKPGAVFQSK
jgi:hypothetical protein